MKLSKRLSAIADLVAENSIVADIGTDHGHIPAYLIENKISKKVIGTDISKGSLDKIVNYVKSLGLEDKIDIRLGDGLEVIRPFEIDTVIIAGMGGLLIRDILEKDKKVSQSIINFVLQPMIAAKELREYLIDNNFKIIKEELVKEDNKYYEIIHAKSGKDFVEKEIHYEISPLLIKDNHPLLKEFLEFKIRSAQKIREELAGSETDRSQERYKELGILIMEYKGVLEEIEGQGNNSFNG